MNGNSRDGNKKEIGGEKMKKKISYRSGRVKHPPHNIDNRNKEDIIKHLVTQHDWGLPAEIRKKYTKDRLLIQHMLAHKKK